MYKVIDVAMMLGVSKVTVYKKISNHKKELKPFTKKVKNITYLTDEAVDIIKSSLSNTTVASGRIINEEIDELHKEIMKLKLEKKQYEEALISQVKNEIDELRGVLRSLDSQIKVKESHLEKKDKVIDNFKDLVKMNKERIRDLEEMLDNQHNF